MTTVLCPSSFVFRRDTRRLPMIDDRILIDDWHPVARAAQLAEGD